MFPEGLLTVTRDRENNSSYPRWAGDNAIAPQEQQRWPGTQSSVSNALTWPGQQNWSAFQFQFSAPEYRPAPQEHQGMPGPHPNLSSIQNQPANHYSAVPHFQSAVPQWRPADQEHRRLPRPQPYLPIEQNQPVNLNSRIPHSQPAIPQKRPADEERRRLPRPQSLLSNVQNQPGHQDSAVRHLRSTVPQRRPADQEERRVQTRSLLHTAPTPPRKPRSKTSRDPFSDSEDSPELLEPSMRESREQKFTPNTIPKRMVETAPLWGTKTFARSPQTWAAPSWVQICSCTTKEINRSVLVAHGRAAFRIAQNVESRE